MDAMGPYQEGRLAGGWMVTLQEWPCSQLLGYYFMASFSLGAGLFCCDYILESLFSTKTDGKH